MGELWFWVIIIIIALLVAASIFFLIKRIRKKRPVRFNPIVGIAFALVLAGILFGDERIVGYSLIGIGVLLALIDIIKKAMKKKAMHQRDIKRKKAAKSKKSRKKR